MNHQMTRRSLLRLFSVGGVAALGGALSGCMVQQGRSPASNVPASAQRVPEKNFVPDLEIDLRAAAARVPILPGKPTEVWTYQGSLVKGDAASLVTLQDNYLGPIIRARKGQKVRINFRNELPAGQPSVIHWHGLHLPEDMDGHPRYAIQPGRAYVYEFEVIDRAGPYWFHPHPHGHTAHQVYQGMAGLFIVGDEEDDASGLPTGEYDVPLVIQDRTFDADNQFVYPVAATGMMSGGTMNHGRHGMDDSATPNSGGMMDGGMQTMMGVLGSRILINGTPHFKLPVATRAYRLRLWNGSNARIYKLGWSTGEPLVVVGSDGGLLEKPVTKPYVMLAPGERVELWADFGGTKPGSVVSMQSLPFEGAEDHGGMMAGMTGNAPQQGAPLMLFTVEVDRSEQETRALPSILSAMPRLREDDTINATNPRPIALTLNGMQWLINGRKFEMEEALPEETVKLGSSEIWEIVNDLNPGQMMDADGMAHPIHIHGAHFLVLSREVLPRRKSAWDTVREGLMDEGWKDTVLVMPGERVKIAMTFRRYSGTFVYHCHNLEHENNGMMRNYRVA